ncbi:MAG: redoxin domain-containing protein [Dehalococcoidia bacterium]
MSGVWLASYIALWAVVLFQGIVIFILLRQLGVIYLGTAQAVARDGLSQGQRAPEFSLPGLDGAPVALAALRGLPLLLVFGSPSCGPCKTLVPELNVFAGEKAGELRVLFLSRGDVEDTRRFVQELDVRVPVAVYPDERLAEQYKVRVTPFAFLLDGEGVVRAKGLANNRQHLDLLLRQAAEGHTPGRSRNGKHANERTPAEEAR